MMGRIAASQCGWNSWKRDVGCTVRPGVGYSLLLKLLLLLSDEDE
jgi:hypothetical protein